MTNDDVKTIESLINLIYHDIKQHENVIDKQTFMNIYEIMNLINEHLYPD